jgi:hypothetical protein
LGELETSHKEDGDTQQRNLCGDIESGYNLPACVLEAISDQTKREIEVISLFSLRIEY